MRTNRWFLILAQLIILASAASAGIQDSPDGVDPLGIFAPLPTTFTPKYYVTREVEFKDAEVPRADPGVPWCAGPGAQTSQQLDAACRDLCKTRNTSSKGCVLFDATGEIDVAGKLTCKCTWLCMPVLKYYQ